MTAGDVLPALQQGTVDGSIGSIVIFTPMRFQDAAKFVTETGQPPVFVVVEISKVVRTRCRRTYRKSLTARLPRRWSLSTRIWWKFTTTHAKAGRTPAAS